MSLTITGNVDAVKPLAVPTTWHRSTDADIAALKAVTDTFPVPSYVGPGSGTIGSQRAVLSDDDIEKCIRDWCWKNFYWTGTNQVTAPTLSTFTSPGGSERAIGIYNWWANFPSLNGGKGPTMGCDTIHFAYCGMLAAYGIPSRPVQAKSLTAGQDTTAEYWSPAKPGWVHVMAHGNAHNIFAASGLPASLWEMAMVERTNGLAATARGAGILTGVGLDGSLGKQNPAHGTNDTLYWASYSNQFIYQRGNKGTTAPTTAVNGVALPGTVLAGGMQFVQARALNDLRYTVNSLHMAADLHPTGMLLCQLVASMIEPAANPLQVLRPAGVGPGTWETIDVSGAYSFYPLVGQTWKFRAVGVQGNTSNIVTVSA